jgi:hypothetical protein
MQHADVLVRSLLDQHEAATLAAVALRRASLRHPPKSLEEYLDALVVQELPDAFAALDASANVSETNVRE